LVVRGPVDPDRLRRYVAAVRATGSRIATAGQELNIAQGRGGRVAAGRQDFTLLLWAK